MSSRNVPVIALAILLHFAPIALAKSPRVSMETNLGAGVTLLGVRRQTGVAPRPATVARSVVMAAVAWALSTAWQTTGVWVVTELVGITAIIIVGLLLLGELATQDLAFARSLLGRDQPTAS